MNKEERIVKDEIQVLLNHLGNKIEISFPLYEMNLLEARANDVGYNLKITAKRDLFDDELAVYGDNKGELPNFHDYFLCLIHSGIVHYSNIDKFTARASSYAQIKKGVHFGLDTNLLYHGFPLNSNIDAQKFIIIDTIQSEIESSINYKYSPQEITDLKRCARFQKHLLDELINAKTKRARRATYLALRQFRAIRDRAHTIPAIEESTSDKEANDLIIVKTLRKFEDDKYSLPVMLTADQNLATLCDAHGLEHFLFEIPYEINERKCTPAEMVSLIFNLAAVFGFIQCNSVNIFGEFRGKGANLDELKLEFLNERIYDRFFQDLKICRRLMKLGIAQ